MCWFASEVMTLQMLSTARDWGLECDDAEWSKAEPPAEPPLKRRRLEAARPKLRRLALENDKTHQFRPYQTTIGLATARDLHDGGAYVSLLDLNADAGAELVKRFGYRDRFFERTSASVNGTSNRIVRRFPDSKTSIQPGALPRVKDPHSSPTGDSAVP